jgi:DNA-binding transcriptional regulator LsrR (DeoR family)
MSRNSPEQPVPVVHIYPSNSTLTSVAAWRHRIDEFSKACAMDVLGVLEKASVIGVSWGDMVASSIAAIGKAPIDRRAANQHVRTIVPLLGEPLGSSITQHSSSVLAARLEEALYPDLESGREHRLSLAPVPALIPADMTELEIGAIKNLISRISAYREIFGKDGGGSTGENESTPLIHRIDAVLTSLSTQERALSFSDDSLIRAAGVSRDKLNDLVIGDLCGALIERPNLNDQARTDVANILARWTGVTIAQLKDCAVRAKSGAPGIVVLAIGANKAPVVHAAVRSGLVQHLFTDQDLANRLEQICDVSTSTT